MHFTFKNCFTYLGKVRRELYYFFNFKVLILSIFDGTCPVGGAADLVCCRAIPPENEILK